MQLPLSHTLLSIIINITSIVLLPCNVSVNHSPICKEVVPLQSLFQTSPNQTAFKLRIQLYKFQTAYMAISPAMRAKKSGTYFFHWFQKGTELPR